MVPELRLVPSPQLIVAVKSVVVTSDPSLNVATATVEETSSRERRRDETADERGRCDVGRACDAGGGSILVGNMDGHSISPGSRICVGGQHVKLPCDIGVGNDRRGGGGRPVAPGDSGGEIRGCGIGVAVRKCGHQRR